ncbi:MAG: SPFH domain-containing protein [Planctomycetota bacterium]|jgi:regulator of protease activity HflC (stomatin/prohibitin superfamily)
MDRREPMTEVSFRPLSGWTLVISQLVYVAAVVALGLNLGFSGQMPHVGFIVLAIASVPLTVFLLIGYFVVPPNIARSLVLFGRYRGTVRDEGFYWTNPFTMHQRISVKARNLTSETIKVNDLVGNPIEIGAVVVWRVKDTAQAAFDVDDYDHFVSVQIETAVRQLASSHPYDAGQADGSELPLRGHAEEISTQLQEAVQQRLDRAGIEIIEARISHLAYAQEIAAAMLQRQQATAIIAARQKIVEGAVGMVEHALESLSEKRVVELDDERRATLVGNLLVVLCGHSPPTPVLNTGSLYS